MLMVAYCGVCEEIIEVDQSTEVVAEAAVKHDQAGPGQTIIYDETNAPEVLMK